MAWCSLPTRSSVATALQSLAVQRTGGMSLLITGPLGMGQETVAEYLGRALLCEKGDGDVCGECSTCLRTAERVHPDLLLFEPEGANHKIDTLREAIVQAQFHPYEAERRVFVVFKADRMQPAAGNCLLKVLEEPPQHVLFILSTDHEEAILSTIISRCRPIKLLPLPADDLTRWLRQKHAIDAEQAGAVAKMSGGRPGLAEDLLGEDWIEKREGVLKLLSAVRGKGGPAVVSEAQTFARDRPGARTLLVTLLGLVRDGLLVQEKIQTENLIHGDRLETISQLWADCSGEVMIERFEATAEAIRRLDGNSNVQATLETVFRTYAT